MQNAETKTASAATSTAATGGLDPIVKDCQPRIWLVTKVLLSLGSRRLVRSSLTDRSNRCGVSGYLVELRGLGFTMSKAYKSLPCRGGWGLMLAVLVFLLCPNWQTSGTGQSPLPHEIAKLPLAGSPFSGGAASGEFLGFARPASDGGQIITLINTSLSWMAVYHVDGTGQIILKGSRQLNQDFEFQYNAVAPLPEEIRRITGS